MLKYITKQIGTLTVAYETWGTLNKEKSNAVLLHTGLSSSAHAKSSEKDPSPGWWENFIGPGCAIDTDKYFVICCNILGSSYGSTGPASIDALSSKKRNADINKGECMYVYLKKYI